MPNRTVARAGVVGLLAASTFALNVGTASAATDPCQAQIVAVQRIDGQFPGFSARSAALNRQIAAHNSQPHVFRMPQQAAQGNAYNARAAALRARQAALRAEATQLDSAKARAVSDLRTCMGRARARARQQDEAQRRLEAAIAERRKQEQSGLEKALECMKGAAEELAGSEPPAKGKPAEPETGPLEVIIDCVNGAGEILAGG